MVHVTPFQVRKKRHLIPRPVRLHKKGVWNLGLARTPRFFSQDVGFQTPFFVPPMMAACSDPRYCSSFANQPSKAERIE
jgi:hypothetical protein